MIITPAMLRIEILALKTCRTLKQIAKEVNARTELYDLRAAVSRGYASTDTKIKGTRLRRQGKGRTGTHIMFFDVSVRRRNALGAEVPVFEHNNAETYRTVEEVRYWLEKHLAMRRVAQQLRTKKGEKS